MALRPRDPALLRKAMYAAGLDTVALAEAAGVTRAHISLIAKGKRGCSTRTAHAISHALGGDVDAFFVVTLTGKKVSKRGKKLKTQSTSVIEVEPEDPYLLFEEVAKLARMPERTLRHLRATGQGPKFFRRGRRLFIRRSKAVAWIESYETEGEQV